MSISGVDGPGSGLNPEGHVVGKNRSGSELVEEIVREKMSGAMKTDGENMKKEKSRTRSKASIWVEGKSVQKLRQEICEEYSGEYTESKYFQAHALRNAMQKYLELPKAERPHSVASLLRSISYGVIESDHKERKRTNRPARTFVFLRPCSSFEDPEGYKLLSVDYLSINKKDNTERTRITTTLIAYNRNLKNYNIVNCNRDSHTNGAKIEFLKEFDSLETLIKNLDGSFDPMPVMRITLNHYLRDEYGLKTSWPSFMSSYTDEVRQVLEDYKYFKMMKIKDADCDTFDSEDFEKSPAQELYRLILKLMWYSIAIKDEDGRNTLRCHRKLFEEEYKRLSKGKKLRESS